MLAFLLAGCNAYEMIMLTVEETNLSINLTPDFNISYMTIPSQEDGSIGQMIIINDTNNKSNSAALMLVSFTDKSMLEIDSNEISNYLENLIFGAFRLTGSEIESYNLTDTKQQNVTVHAFDMSDPNNPESRELSFMALWKLDRLNYFFVFSSEKSLVNRIIESLEASS